MTLIETIAGTALVGTVLVSIIMASANFNTQTARADQRIMACRLADELLESWWAQDKTVPENSSGLIEKDDSWTWATKLVKDPKLKKLNCNRIALEIQRSDSNEAACRIELLVSKDETE